MHPTDDGIEGDYIHVDGYGRLVILYASNIVYIVYEAMININNN